MHVKIYCLTTLCYMHMPEGIQFLSIPLRSIRRDLLPPNAKKPYRIIPIRLSKKWRRPTLPLLRSTIGADRLNFSVRYGKRWNPVAITTWMLLDVRCAIYDFRCIIVFLCCLMMLLHHTSQHHTSYIRYNFNILFKNQNEINHPTVSRLLSALIPFCLLTPLKCETKGDRWKIRVISTARLWCYHLYTCSLSTSSSLTSLMDILSWGRLRA